MGGHFGWPQRQFGKGAEEVARLDSPAPEELGSGQAPPAFPARVSADRTRTAKAASQLVPSGTAGRGLPDAQTGAHHAGPDAVALHGDVPQPQLLQ